jgi:hypothetical protein
MRAGGPPKVGYGFKTDQRQCAADSINGPRRHSSSIAFTSPDVELTQALR